MNPSKAVLVRSARALAALVISMSMLSGCARVAAVALGADATGPGKMVYEHNVMVPMRDGVKLATDVYRPAGPGPFPVVLTRIPYGKNEFPWKELARIFVMNGYVYVIQDTRGEFDSEGDWFPLIWEYEDGHDTVAWVKAQPWASGKIGMWGGSYFGYTQLTAAPDNPDLTCMVPLVTSGSMGKIIFRGGALEFASVMGWLAGERTSQLQREGKSGKVEPDLAGGFYNEPLRDARQMDFEKIRTDPALLAQGPEAWLKHPGDVSGLPPLNYEEYYDKVSAPGLNVAGWYDIFLGPQLHDFNRFRKDGIGDAKDTRIIIGPWVHGALWSKFEPDKLSGARLFVSSFMDWYDHWLKGVNNGADTAAPLKIFVMGENKWRDENEWPLARTVFTDYYLHSNGRANTGKGDGSLSLAPPAAEPADKYDYDPRNPVPTAGGAFLGTDDVKPGPMDQRAVSGRDDVLVFATAPLEKPIEVTGPLTLTLWAASSAKDTDFIAKLVDVDPLGKAIIIQEGIIRARYRNGCMHPEPLEPGEVHEFSIDLWATSNLFKKGHRIGVYVTSSDFPQFDRNQNAAGEGGPDNIIVAHQSIYHDAQHPSRIVLPVIPR
ncbi:MAG TPA: CocE/NonD family hydrolase [bacterium]|nr:CocE/NonD family hydrolase [bacterium]